jgi:accessory gene regulator B
VEVLLATVMNFAMLYLLAIVSDQVWQTTMFIVGFVPLRSLAGGYHAKTHFRCLMTLLFTYAVFLAIIYLMPQELYISATMICVSLSLILVWLLSPVEDKNKPLSASEQRYFRGRSRFTILIYAGIVLSGIYMFQHSSEFLCVSIGLLSVSFSLVAAYFENRKIARLAAEPQ